METIEIIVRIPAALRLLTDGQDEVRARGATLGEVLDDLERRHPGFKERLLDGGATGTVVRRFINIYVGDDDVRSLQGLATPTRAGAPISIVPAIAGGAS